MSKKRSLLDLRNYGTRAVDLDNFKQDLFEKLLPKIFDFDSLQELYYESLKFVKPVNQQVKNNPKSILSGINKVLSHFFRNKKEVRISKLTDAGFKPIPKKKKEKDPIKDFQDWIIGFDKVPKNQLNNLLIRTKDDLRKINDLIKHYEEQTEVQEFLQERRVRRTHNSKLILDFYVRCLQERQKVLDYYLDGIYERAIQKSRAQIFPMLALSMVDAWKDYPYETGRIKGRTMDYREIDCFSHRVSDLYIDEIPELKILHTQDKEKFYRILFKRKSKELYFDSIFFNLDQVPLSRDRKYIFEELKDLFNKKKWLAFYALALPQVEGLFSEMVTSANPKSSAVTKALPDKVKSVRPDYLLSSSYFDYYEYHLPNQRNSFSHSGFVDDYKIKAFEIFTDLEHVLSVFASLQNPLVNLTQIIKKSDPFLFSNHNGFNDYFLLLDQLPQSHKNHKELKKDIKSFSEDFLKTQCSIEYIIEEATLGIDESHKKLWATFKSAFLEFDLPDDWNKINKPKLKSLLEHTSFQEKAQDTFRYNRDEIQEILTLETFFNGITKHLYSEIPENIMPYLEKWKKNKRFPNWVRNFQSMLFPSGNTY